MKVKDLIKILLKVKNQDSKVILSIDSEGNGYAPVSKSFSTGVFVNEDFYSDEHSAEDNCMEEEDWEELKSNKKLSCIVLWPN